MTKDTKDTKHTIGASRRDFFRIASATGAIAVGLGAATGEAMAGALPAPKANQKKWLGGKFPKGTVMAKGRVLGANDRINVGHVGVGNMGTTHLKDFKKMGQEWNAVSAAVCDPYNARIERAKGIILGTDGAAGGTLQTDKDYRKLLDNKDIDAVLIATPEHWHCQVAVHALEAGKHSYVQKPMARYIDEAFALYDTWKKSDRIVQVGSQGTSDPKYHAAREVVASGKLGPLVNAQSSYTRNPKDGEWNYPIDADAGPDNLDWALWLGSAAKRPWNEDSKERYFRYRKYRDYSAGILGDLMPHRLHPVLFALGGNSFPLKVSAMGTRNISTDREVPDTIHVTAEMEGGWTFQFLGSTVNEQGWVEQIRGHKATVYLAGKEPEIKPERAYSDEFEAAPIAVKDSGESNVKHVRNWLDSIRANKQPNCDMELAIRAQVLICMAEISETTGRAVHFDPKKRTWKFA